MRFFLSQGKHTAGILKEVQYDRMQNHRDGFEENDEDSDEIAQQLIGSLTYLVNTRPNSCYVVNVLSQSMTQPRQTHWIAVKHVLRYIYEAQLDMA
jgi:hypothetical protein